MSKYKSSAELKQLARTQLLGHYKTLIGAIVLTEAISLLISYIISDYISPATVVGKLLYYAITFVSSLIIGIFNIGHCLLFLKLACEQPINIADIFHGFKNNTDKVIVLQAFHTVASYICTGPQNYFAGKLIDPNNIYNMNMEYFLPYCISTFIGIILLVVFSLIFSQTFYLLLDFPDASVKQILSGSYRIMKGNLGHLFYLEMSFLPLLLLGALSFGIAYLWLIPYMQATQANFFLDIMKKAE